ncbi:MAG: hypothetical protein ACT6UH_07125 [Hydrogenophaga sp.]|jgi:hypothetical protein|uniref:hypothetical protein n=1 Tax=Hydrogenophaga sp. TaxID=1904254 RepID=UPI004036913D
MKTDTSNMSAAELREMAASLIRQAEEQSTREFESTMSFLSDKLKHMGRTKKDAVIHLLKMMRSSEMEDTLADLVGGSRRTSKKERADLDCEGNAPEVGVTYKLPSGDTWTRKGKVGATKREFALHAKTTTWAKMRA